MSSDENVLDVIINNIETSIINALRRTIINGLTTFVIDTVKIIENDSNLCDEMIAHRLGQIPLVRKNTSHKHENLTIKLEQSGPKRVYSRDIIFPEGIEAVSPNIILVDLGAQEILKLTGTIEEGTAFEQGHSKFSVSCGTTYKKILTEPQAGENSFIFHIETTGSMTAKEALLGSINVLKDELISYKKMI